MKRILCMIGVVVLIAISLSQAMSEQTVWDCPECGKKENAKAFCGGCGHPAPYTQDASDEEENLTSAGLGAETMKELSQQADGLIQLAATWTDETVPQTMDTFPAFLKNLMDIRQSFTQEMPVLEKKGKRYLVRLPFQGNTILKYLPKDLDHGYGMALSYDDDRSGNAADLTQETPDTFSFALPARKTLNHIHAFRLYNLGNNADPEAWYPSLSLEYGFSEGSISGEVSVGFIMFKTGCSIVINPGLDTNSLYVDICGTYNEKYVAVQLVYDMKTGKLLEWKR